MKYLSINPDIIYGLLIIVGGILFLILFIKNLIEIITIIWSNKALKSRKSEAFEMLLNELAKDTLNEKTIRFVFGQLLENRFDYSLEEFLGSFLMYVRKNDTNGEQTRKIETIVDPIMEIEKGKNAYSKLENNERSLLLDIEALAKADAGSVYVPIKNKLNTLAGEIERKQRIIDEAIKTKRKSVTLTIIGVLLTLINVVVVFVYKPSISEKSIQEITRQMDSITRQSVKIDTVCEWVGVENSLLEKKETE